MLIQFNSHRAREKATQIVGKLPEYYSFRSHNHVYEIPEDKHSLIKDITGVKTLKKGNIENYLKCW